ncbi:MAG: tetratricopeptide repeat protein [Desulfovibrio sp.]|nr:tetratricopeptide repeat protein [Desulfovibrio sp.]
MTQEKTKPALASSDILAMQDLLCEGFSPFISFQGHALYFPTQGLPEVPELVSREHKLLLPLTWQEKALGVLVLQGVRAREVRRLMGWLPALTALCLENLARARAELTDPVTGLAAEVALYARMEEEAAAVQGAEDMRDAPLHRLCLGLVLVRLCNGEEIAARCGHAFVDDLLRRLAEAVRPSLSSDVLAARAERYGTALLFHADGHGACRELADKVMASWNAVHVENPVTKQTVHLVLSAGYALFPQDMRGPEMRLPMYEQSRLLMRRAALACDVAGPGRILSHGAMLAEGGRIIENLPLGRMRISLGRQMGVRPGMRFAVFGTEPRRLYKGDLTVLQARKMTSVAEMGYQEDPGIMFEPGDTLVFQKEGFALAAHEARMAGDAVRRVAEETEKAAGTSDILLHFAAASDGLAVFTLVFVRVTPNGSAAVDADTPEASRGADVPRDARDGGASGDEASVFDDAMAAWRGVFGDDGANVSSGRRGVNTLFFFHPGEKAEDLLPKYAVLCGELENKGYAAAAGLAGWPFVSSDRSFAPECALMALEYALLLPSPHAGVCDSLALNISGDRRYSMGDVFGAVEDYKLALVADENNAMARNSLGVCMAALGRRDEARRHFLEALKRKPDGERVAQICYNLGTLCQNAGDSRGARRYFRQCVKNSPEHLFAWIRLGRLCEQSRHRADARRCYETAAAIEEKEGDVSNLARRHLAALAAHQRKGDEAREILQGVLRRDPGDAAALLLLARLYLAGGEDPSLAEMLARKSVTLHDRPDAWQTLADALRALGREEDACRADARALLA